MSTSGAPGVHHAGNQLCGSRKQDTKNGVTAASHPFHFPLPLRHRPRRRSEHHPNQRIVMHWGEHFRRGDKNRKTEANEPNEDPYDKVVPEEV